MRMAKGALCLLGVSLLLALSLAACGGGGSDSVTSPPASLQLSSSASEAFNGVASVITLTASGQTSGDTVNWALNGAGSLSASTGGSVKYTPPMTISVASEATITATVRGVSQKLVIELHPYGQIALLAGRLSGAGTLDGSTPQQARFIRPSAMTRDAAGSLYIIDPGAPPASRLRKIPADGVVTTLATRDVQGNLLTNSYWDSLASDDKGGLYLTASYNIVFRSADGVVRTLATASDPASLRDGPLASAQFGAMTNLVADGAGGVYFLDGQGWKDGAYNIQIRHLSAQGLVSTLVPQSLPAPELGSPSTLAIGSDGNIRALYYKLASDASGVTQVSLTLRTFRPDGTELQRIYLPTSGPIPGGGAYVGKYDDIYSGATAVDGQGNFYLAVSDFIAPMVGVWIRSYVIRITPAGLVSVWGGTPGRRGFGGDGMALATGFNNPQGIVADTQGNLLVADSYNHTIRRVSQSAQVTDYAGGATNYQPQDGQGAQATFSGISAMAWGNDGKLRVLDGSVPGYTPNTSVGEFKLRTIDLNGAVTTGATFTWNDSGDVSQYGSPLGLSLDGQGNVYAGYGLAIRKQTPGGLMSTLAGSAKQAGYDNGSGAQARFRDPNATVTDAAGNVYVADGDAAYTIRKITPAGVVSTLAGTAAFYGQRDGVGTAASFGAIKAMTIDIAGNLYALDKGDWPNNVVIPPAIRKITPAGVVSTLVRAPSVSSIVLLRATGIAVDEQGNVYLSSGKLVSDYDEEAITPREVPLGMIYKLMPNGTLSIVAGDETGARSGIALGVLPGSIDYPVGISYLGKHRFAVALQDSVLMLTLP
ncbi:NHL repeat-containing protein [Chitinimonas naiadis]